MSQAQIISNWFLEHVNEFTVLERPPVTRSQSNKAPLGDSHHGCAAEKSAATAFMSIWTKISEKCL